jgi:cytochrome c553
MRASRLGWLIVCGLLPFLGVMASAAETIPAEQLSFFEKKIRPVLVEKCYSCHTAEKTKGGLTLDSREGIRAGGDTGPAIVPGSLNKSLLIQAIRHSGDLKMPKEKLPDEVIKDFERWVTLGAPDPREGKVEKKANVIDIEKGREFWSFQPPKKPSAPPLKDATWAKTEIDRFVHAQRESRQLKPVEDADKSTLLRRVYFDLIGLPPTPEQVRAFLSDASPKAFERVVDELLKSPQFGERWGRHWLDVARYAESSGKTVNITYPHAWRYRDYVIDSFNKDKPYTQFLKEQLAGDLLPSSSDAQKAEQLVATGFLAIGSKNHNERSPIQFRADLVDEQIDTFSQSMLGLSVACARCHDHKFDPIPMKDYYALAGIFSSSEPLFGTIQLLQNLQTSALHELPASVTPLGEKITPDAIEKMRKDLTERKKERDAIGFAERMGSIKFLQLRTQISQLESKIASYTEDGTSKSFAMGVRDRRFPSDARLYIRGEVTQPGESVKRGFVSVVTNSQPTIRRGSGRLELAEWVASKENPLTARVMVNRIWLHLFGEGIVPTADNFGVMGQPPSNLPLLDYLAVRFQEQNYSVKQMIREIVLSRTYQLDSKFDPKNFAIDPDNTYLWRASQRRLDAEAIRDSILFISGRLDTTPVKGSPVAKAGDTQAAFVVRFGRGDGANDLHRSVYLPILRDLEPESLQLFDFADSGSVTGERASTNVPSQGLFLLNSPLSIRSAESLGSKLQSLTVKEMVQQAYLLCYGREPNSKELKLAEQFVTKFIEEQSKSGPPARFKLPNPANGPARRLALETFCQSLFASAEFRYVK